MSRKKAREAAVLLLYHWDMMQYSTDHIETTLGETISGEEPDNQLNMDLNHDDKTYIANLMELVRTNQSEIDSAIASEAVGWKLDRLPKVDLAILRLGVCELKYMQDIPPAVSINECVDLAKHYSTENSGTFINGVLSTILKKLGEPQCRCSE